MLLESEAMLADPLIPFDIPGGPPAGLTLNTPVTVTVDGLPLVIMLTPAYIEQAYRCFLEHYQAQPGVDHTPTISRAHKARTALLTRPWQILLPAEVRSSDASSLDAGSILLLPGSGSRTYQVDDQDCRLHGVRAARGGPAYCPDSIFATTRKRDRAKRAVGEMFPVACYHTIARELLRLAVVFACTEARASLEPAICSSEDLPCDRLDSTALSSIAAVDLWAVCSLMQHTLGEITIQLSRGSLEITRGKRRAVLDGTGAGTTSVSMQADDFLHCLWQPLNAWPLAHTHTPVELFIDLSGDEPLLGVTAEAFGAVGPVDYLAL